MDKRFIIPVLVVLTMILVPFSAQDSNAETGTVNNVVFNHFDETHSLTINDTCQVSLSLKNNNGSDVLVTISQSGSNSIQLVGGAGDYPISKNSNIVISLDFKPDKYSHMGDYDTNITIGVFNSGDPGAGTVTKDTTFKFKIISIYSTEQYYNKILGMFDNPLPEPFNTVESTVAISACLWVAIAFALTYVLQSIITFAFKGIEEKNKKINSKVITPIFICILLFGIINCLRIYGCDENLINTLSFWVNLFYIPLISLIGWKIYEAIVYRILNNLEKKTGNEYLYEALSPLLDSIGKIAIIAIATAALLATLGLNLFVIITGAGIAGLAVSFGTKSAFNEFFSGLTVLVTRPFRVGDTIKLTKDGDEMTVKKVGLLNTELVGRYNVEHFVLPNSMIASSSIINLTRVTKKYRIYVYVTVDVHDNLELAKKLISDSGYEDPNVITDGSYSKPHVKLEDITNGIATFRLAVYLNNVDDKETVYGRLREAILKKFNENGISIPFQQITITIKDDRKGVTE